MIHPPIPRIGGRLLAIVAAVSLAAGVSTAERAGAQPIAPAAANDATRNASTRDDDLSPRLAAIADSTLTSANRPLDGTAGATPLTAADAGRLQTDGRGRLVVDVTLSGSSDAALASLEQVGAELIATDGGPVLATVAVPARSLRALAALPAIAYVAEVPEPIRADRLVTTGLAPSAPVDPTCAARTVSESDTQLRAADLRTASGADGSGVVIGVVSDSYDNLGDAGTDIADGELPGVDNPCGRVTPLTVQSELANGGSDEGRAMLQLVHDLAPGAELAFATGAAGEVAMAEQIRQLGIAGADIVTDDIGYLSEPMFQDGLIAQAIEENRTERDILHFSSAGNANAIIDGKNVTSYEAPAFRPTACPAAVPAYSPTCHDADGSGGTDSGAGLTLEAGGSIILALGWSEPMYGVTTDLDLYLVDTSTGLIADRSELNNAETKRATEYLFYENTTGGTRTFDVVIGRYGAGLDPTGTPRLRTVLVRSSGLIAVEYDESSDGNTVGPTIYGHAAESTAMSVAAIEYDTTSEPEPFSSRGPAAQCWQQVDGTTPQPPITPCDSSTIDITATDGAANSFFGTLVGGTYRFYGTSAAAPHAAAVAAVLVDAHPCAGSDDVATAMTSSASPIGSFGIDAVGAGLVDGVAASSALDAITGCPPTIGSITNVHVIAGQTSEPISVSLADADDPAASLVTSVASANPALLPASAVEIHGSGADRSMTISPPAETSGAVEVTVTVTDPSGRKDTATFTVTMSLPADPEAVGAFDSLTPARFADSRDESTFDGRYRNTGQRAAGTTWEIDIAGRGDVPDDATAVVVNLTIVDGAGPGFATVAPCDGGATTSTVNYTLGGVEANEVVGKLSSSGTICVFTLTRANVIVDVVGFVAIDSPYRPLAPARFADSRDESTFDGRYRNTGQRAAGTTWEIDIAGRGDVPDDAIAVVANVTVTGGATPGFATVHPCGELPNASSLNYGSGITRPNEVVARLSSSGTVCIYTLTDVDVIVDVVGYVPDTPGVTTATPRRYADSRQEQTLDGAFRDTGARAGGTTWEIDIAGRGDVPPDASAVIANVTVVGAGGPGFATVHPCGALPNASSLNYDGGTVRANEVVAKLSARGSLCVFTLTDADVIVDIVGHL